MCPLSACHSTLPYVCAMSSLDPFPPASPQRASSPGEKAEKKKKARSEPTAPPPRDASGKAYYLLKKQVRGRRGKDCSRFPPTRNDGNAQGQRCAGCSRRGMGAGILPRPAAACPILAPPCRSTS